MPDSEDFDSAHAGKAVSRASSVRCRYVGLSDPPSRRTGTAIARTPPVPAVADEGLCSADDLAGSLRTELSRLAFHLRTPATKSGITPTRLAALAALARHDRGAGKVKWQLRWVSQLRA
jgi:hypothetical protein